MDLIQIFCDQPLLQFLVWRQMTKEKLNFDYSCNLFYDVFIYTTSVSVDHQKEVKEYEKDCPRSTLVIHFNYVCLSEHCCFYKRKVICMLKVSEFLFL